MKHIPFITLLSLVLTGASLFAEEKQAPHLSPDQPAKLKETPNREKLGYTLLSDSAKATAKAFKISFQVPDELVAKYKNEYQIDLEAASGKTHHLLPHPQPHDGGSAQRPAQSHRNPEETCVQSVHGPARHRLQPARPAG